MKGFVAQTEEREAAFRNWKFQETVEMEHKKQELSEAKKLFEEERKHFEDEKRQFELEKKEFILQRQFEDRKAEQEEKLFNMKWKILEDELKKLALEKEYLLKQREFYRRVSDFERQGSSSTPTGKVVKGEIFFCGVDSELTLKKRYKDLIKIYHPDNICGDTTTIQEINSEYEKLLALYE